MAMESRSSVVRAPAAKVEDPGFGSRQLPCFLFSSDYEASTEYRRLAQQQNIKGIVWGAMGYVVYGIIIVICMTVALQFRTVNNSYYDS